MFNQNAEYAFNLPCRRLAAVAPSSSHPTSKSSPSKSASSSFDYEDDSVETASSSTSHRYLVGTAFPSVSKLSGNASADGDNNNNLSIIEEDDENRTNRLFLLQYHEDSNELSLETSFVHPMGEIWSMACHPKKADWVVTCGGGAVFSPIGEEKKDNDSLAHFQTTLWKIPDSNANDDDDDDNDSNFKTLTKSSLSADGDDFWSENNNNNNQDPSKNRNRTASATSAVTSISSRLEPVLTIPHGQRSHDASISGWEQRVGQILWNPLLYPNSSSGDPLVDLAETSSHEGGGNIISVGWDAARSPITLWDISSMSEAKEIWSTKPGNDSSTTAFRRGRGRLDRFSGLNSALPRRASWDPHEVNHILATAGVDVVAYDMRCPPREVGVIRSAHRYGVTDVCHNHLQSNVVVTSGMDGIVKYWDLRMHMSQRRSSSTTYLDTSKDDAVEADCYAPPTLLKAVRGGHSHWAIRATYNPFYDQLVLSGGTDAITNLWRISSCSSAPLLDLGGDEEDGDVMNGSYFESYDDEGEAANEEEGREEEDSNKENDQTTQNDEENESDKLKVKSPPNGSSAPDIKVTGFECSDVTTDITWSASDPWVYATLSCDGGLVVHHVPRKEKYKILL